MDKFIAFVILLTFLSSKLEAQKKNSKNYEIYGSTSCVDSGKIIMFSLESDEPIDSAFIKFGRFTLRGQIGLPRRMRFKITPGNWNFRAFVEDTTIHLFIDTLNAEVYPHYALIWDIKEDGTQLGAVVKKFKDDVQFNHYQSLLLSLMDQSQLANSKMVESTTLKRDSLLNIFMSIQFRWIKNYIDSNPSSIAGVFLLNEFVSNNKTNYLSLDLLNSLLNKIVHPAKSSHYYLALVESARLIKGSQLNTIAPDVILLQRSKEPFSLSSLKGKYVLINFWASWCVPCLKSIPFWIEVFNKYKNKDLTIVGISNDRNWDDWINALDKEDMPWLQLIDSFPDKNSPAIAASKFGTKGLPYYVLLDKERRIILSSSEKDIIKNKLSELLDKRVCKMNCVRK